MKIVHWAKFYPPEWGGMERVTFDLAVATAQMGYKSTVVAFSRDGALPSEAEDRGVKIFRSRMRLNPANQPLSPKWIIQAFRSGWRSDALVIHAPNYLAALPLFLLCCARLLGYGPSTRILFWHSDVVGKGWLGQLLRPFEFLLCSMSTAIVGTSPPYVAASPILRKYGPKVHVVALGIEAPDAHAAAEPLPDDIASFVGTRPVLLGVGRLVPYKGFDVFVQAMGHVASDAVAVLVGTGPEEDRLRHEIVVNGLENRVLLAGSRTQRELTALFERARAYVMSSRKRSEAFGVVLLEAMSYKLPIIATDIPGSGVPWVAEHGRNAFVCPPDDPEGLAAAINLILQDEKLSAKLARAGYERFRTEFTREAMVEKILTLCGAQ